MHDGLLHALAERLGEGGGPGGVGEDEPRGPSPDPADAQGAGRGVHRTVVDVRPGVTGGLLPGVEHVQRQPAGHDPSVVDELGADQDGVAGPQGEARADGVGKPSTGEQGHCSTVPA